MNRLEHSGVLHKKEERKGGIDWLLPSIAYIKDQLGEVDAVEHETWRRQSHRGELKLNFLDIQSYSIVLCDGRSSSRFPSDRHPGERERGGVKLKMISFWWWPKAKATLSFEGVALECGCVQITHQSLNQFKDNCFPGSGVFGKKIPLMASCVQHLCGCFRQKPPRANFHTDHGIRSTCTTIL